MELKWVTGSEAAALLNPHLKVPINGQEYPMLSRALLAMDGDKLIGYFVVQMIPMAGPVWMDHDAPPTGFLQLMGSVREFLEQNEVGWLVEAENPRMVKVCEDLGYKRLENPLFLGKKKGV